LQEAEQERLDAQLDGRGGRQISLNQLRTNEVNKEIFWNLIYYFNEHSLPFDCILPYEDDGFGKRIDKYKTKY
jgi:hypothetical protein